MSNDLTLKSMVPQGFSHVNIGRTFIGIDFGTSTTVVSVAAYDNIRNTLSVFPIRIPQLLEDGTLYEGEKLPTVIAWYKEHLLVGEGASNLKYILERGKDIWYSFKMEIGEDLGAKYYNSQVKLDGYTIRNPKDCVRVFFMFLSAQIQRYCENNGLSTNISYAVSIPASFEANQRKELMEALETNGMSLSRQSLIDEPNAAFISYVFECQKSDRYLQISPHYNTKVLVFDFGAGTCDISILEIGKSAKGFYSKNVAISKFTQLGGDDVDRYIAYNYLLPRFLAENGKTPEDYRNKELQFIVTQLYKIAEQLKILICKDLSNKMYDFKLLESYKQSQNKTSVHVDIVLDTSKGILRQSDFYLTNAEFTEVMSVFTRPLKGRYSSGHSLTRIKGDGNYNTIIEPIESAIKKANIDRDELDYVLLIGGSAQNPYIQEKLSEHFAESKILVPRDLQTHVSQGAAIHSLLMNGMNKCIIQPITSEPLFVITTDSTNRVLIPAGTQIPCDTVVVDDLVTKKDGQLSVELPICVGSQSKMLFNLKITRNDERGFPVNTPVKLVLELTADKLLIVQAECMGMKCIVEPQNPFANKELTTEERIVLVAEREANIDAERNGGVPSRRGLENLREAYERAGNDFMAAETYEQQYELYPNSVDLNNIGVLYHNSGNYDKAQQFYELAYEKDPNNSTIAFNLGHTIKDKDPERAKKLIEKAYRLNSSHCPALIELARMEEAAGNRTHALELRQRAFDILNEKWKRNSLAAWQWGWFAMVADELGKHSLASEIRQSKPKSESEVYFNPDNLTGTKSLQIDKY